MGEGGGQAEEVTGSENCNQIQTLYNFLISGAVWKMTQSNMIHAMWPLSLLCTLYVQSFHILNWSENKETNCDF